MSGTLDVSAPYRLYAKRGEADCSIAAMATIFRRDYELVLIAASAINKHVWRSGLHFAEFPRVARKLGIRARWHTSFDVEHETGVLWTGSHDSTKEHVVSLIEGKIADPDHDPVSFWDYDDYYRATNRYGSHLLVVED